MHHAMVMLVAAIPFQPRDRYADCAVCDLRYRPRPVDLVAAALEAGHPAGDGLEMLLHQGMLSFRRWTGLEPPWDAARAALLAAVAAWPGWPRAPPRRRGAGSAAARGGC